MSAVIPSRSKWSFVRNSVAVAASLVVLAGCPSTAHRSEGASTTDSVVTDSIVVDATDTIAVAPTESVPATDAVPITDAVGQGSADVLAPAIAYVDQAFAAIEPERSVDPAGYCRDLASTMRDPQTAVQAPADASADVVSAVQNWSQQTALLAGVLDSCAGSADAAGFVASGEFTQALDAFNAYLTGVRAAQ